MNTFAENLSRLLAARRAREADATDRTPAAVLVPLFERAGEPHVLFTKRSQGVKHHRGEISFPGGTREPQDADLLATALREMREELSIDSSDLQVLGRLDAHRTVSSSFMVVPFVAWLKKEVRFSPQKTEVDEILIVPLKHFENPDILRVERREIDRELRAIYYYRWQSHTIWGLTARILKSLLDLLDSTGAEHD